MAAETVSSNAWVQVRRVGRPVVAKPRVLLRTSGDIACNAAFVRLNGLLKHCRANVFVSTDGISIGLKFHSNQSDPDGFVLGFDGGSGRNLSHDGRVIQTGSMLQRDPGLAAYLSEPLALREFTPERDSSGIWALHLAPAFRHDWADRLALGVTYETSGLYRYRYSGDVVYIGRGKLCDRISDPVRSAWSFDKIEFSIVNDSDAEAKWESFWLKRYSEKFGRLPLYNRIGGLRAVA